MPENSAISSAEGFAHAASQNYGEGLDFVRRLQSAAQQQLQQQDQQRQEAFKNALELANQGYTPLTQDPTFAPAPAGSGLAHGLGTRTKDNPAAQGLTGPTVTDPQGRQYQKGSKLDDSNSFTLTEDLAKEAGAMGGALKPGQRYPLTVLEHLNSAVERQRSAEQRKSEFDVRDKERQAGATESTRRFDEQDKDRENAAAERQREFTAREQERQDARVESARRFAITLGEQRERLQNTKDEKQRRDMEDAQKQVDRYQSEEQKWHQLAQGYGDALKATDGEQVVDPKTNKKLQMDKAQTGGGILSSKKPYEKGPVRQEFERRYQEAAKHIEHLQRIQKTLVAAHGGDTGTDATATPATQPAAAVPAKAAAAPAKAAPSKPRIKVKLQDGRTGTIDAADWDSKTMTRL